MNIEFHYYMIYYLAKKAGFNSNDCYTLAYSSQHTDDNRTIYNVERNEEIYKNYVSQTMDIFKPRMDLMRIYLCYHFLPGDIEKPSAYRKDGKLHLLTTTPNSSNAIKIMENSITKNLYNFGVALHVLADTWAHQNFAGNCDEVNAAVKTIKTIIPNIGHADFLHNPDIVSLKWEDQRLIPSHSEINNKSRMLEAAKNCFYWMLKYRNNNISEKETETEWNKIKDDLSRAMGDIFTGNDTDRETRIAEYKKIIGSDFIEYEEEDWFNKAVHKEKKKAGFPWFIKKYIYKEKENFETSDWYMFQEAVKDHQKNTKSLLSSTLQKMEINNF